ncbi:MAG: glycosyltransferase family 39 protein [Chloroflexi bacterium]|nr:glycosyltransferase family 39 protein [Chloroflexota bacterium]
MPTTARAAPSTARAARSALWAIGALLAAIVGLLALGRLAIWLWPVALTVEGQGQQIALVVDGERHALELERPVVAVRFASTTPYRREYQIDGSDSTNNFTFDAPYFERFGTSLYYRFQALLREEWRYSQWRRLVIQDSDGHVIIADRPADEVVYPLAGRFQLRVDLERLETPRSIELLDQNLTATTVEINRNDRFIRVRERQNGARVDVAHWYFPRDWRPPLASLVDLLTRTLALALGLVLLVGLAASTVPGVLRWRPGGRATVVLVVLGLSATLAGSLYAATALFDRAPHILDAVAYYTQAKTFASGRLWAPAPPLKAAFPTPFTVVDDGRWFAQYPPGTAALLATGFVAGLPWLVEPVLATGAVLLAYLAARRQYGPPTALLALLLLATSPFLFLIAGSFLSHLPAMFFGSVMLYAVTRYVERPAHRWATLAATGLGALFLTREVGALFYAAALGVFSVLAGWRRGRVRTNAGVGAGADARMDCTGPARTVLAFVRDGLLALVVFGGALLAYLAYNAALTGSPFVLPRLLFDAADVYGFGVGRGFYGEHTLAAGLVNTDELLTSLAITAAGWPIYASLAVPLLPFLTRRHTAWDVAHASLVGIFVLGYIGYYYHGIAFGPRYYFEMLPSLAMLTARGFAALAGTVAGWLAERGRRDAWWRARQAALGLAALLVVCDVSYFLPRTTTLYAGYTGLPGSGPGLGNIAQETLAGRAPSEALDGALVLTDQWWMYAVFLAPLNQPDLERGTIFALATDDAMRDALRTRWPERPVFMVRIRDGALTAEPVGSTLP